MKRHTTIFGRRGFTLMEVNLAIFIMAAGVLGMVALYPLGFREGTHSRSDVVEATVADGILNPLVAALSSTNMTWSSWEQLVNSGSGSMGIYPSDGWLDSRICDGNFVPKSYSSICGEAQDVINKINGACPGSEKPASVANTMLNYAKSKDMACALVFSTGSLPNQQSPQNPHRDRSRIVLALRVSRSSRQLFESPVFYTEVHFQGQREQ